MVVVFTSDLVATTALGNDGPTKPGSFALAETMRTATGRPDSAYLGDRIQIMHFLETRRARLQSHNPYSSMFHLPLMAPITNQPSLQTRSKQANIFKTL